VAMTQAGEWIISPAFAVAAVDTLGAGDAFAAALCVALARGDALPQALQFANACGAIVAQQPGVLGALPDAAQVSTFMHQRQATLPV